MTDSQYGLTGMTGRGSTVMRVSTKNSWVPERWCMTMIDPRHRSAGLLG